MIDINDLTLGQIKEISAMSKGQSEGVNSIPYKVGEKKLLRTVTMITIGRIDKIVGDFLVMGDASWIADTGRFSTTLKNGVDSLDEVEPYPNGCEVNMLSIVDSCDWDHDLPAEQK